MDDRIHAKTFGPDGSYPKAVCGYRGGTKGRMIAAPAHLLPRLAFACPDCVTAIANADSRPSLFDIPQA